MTNDKAQAVQETVRGWATWVGKWLTLSLQMIKAIVVGAGRGSKAGYCQIQEVRRAVDASKDGTVAVFGDHVGYHTDDDGIIRCPQCKRPDHQDRARCCWYCGYQLTRNPEGLRMDARANGKLAVLKEVP